MDIFRRELLQRNGLKELEHQVKGLEWCSSLERDGVEVADGRHIYSGIVADEMGLGKTIQMLALIISNLRDKPRTLIVLPRALVEQWHTTIINMLGHSPHVVHGTSRDILDTAPITITTYGTLTAHMKRKDSGSLHQERRWSRVIFDEAHHLRNHRTAVFKAAESLAADHKWMLSGTPIQNSLSDIRSLCHLACVASDLTKSEEGLKLVIPKIMLRRTKESIGMVLPGLVRVVTNVEWETDAEKHLAEDIHAMLSFSGITRKEMAEESDPPHHFALMQQARQSCIDSGLLISTLRSLEDYGILRTSTLAASSLVGRSKVNAVVRLLLDRPREMKKLVFCHYRREIDSFVKILSIKGLKVGSFDGRTSVSERKELLIDMTLDVLVIQIKTGCEGLNLQHFSEVYFVTPHWNPAVEDQAIGRCYRQGQQKIVRAFSFRMAPFDDERSTHSLDSHISRCQMRKRILMCLVEQDSADAAGPALNDRCAICLENQHPHDHIKLPCGHCFHVQCMSSWLERSPTCPTCRQ
jgi:SNF2 family DNA or RNA helicase